MFSKSRSISLGAHLVYLGVTFVAGLAAALVLWHQWFDSWPAAIVVVGTIEFLALSSLILYVCRIQWPLAAFRHFLPFLSIAPLGYETYELLAAHNSDLLAVPIALGLTAWFVFISHVLLRSLENLFIDPVQAARERAKEQMTHVGIELARYQEMRLATETFARSVLPPAISGGVSDVSLPALQAPLSLTDQADPRFLEIVRMAGQREHSGAWTFSPEQIGNYTRADGTLVTIVCKMVRSGQLQSSA